MLRSASQARAVVLASRRYESSVRPKKDEELEKKKELSPMATLPRNAPDYNVPIDIATSYELPPRCTALNH